MILTVFLYVLTVTCSPHLQSFGSLSERIPLNLVPLNWCISLWSEYSIVQQRRGFSHWYSCHEVRETGLPPGSSPPDPALLCPRSLRATCLLATVGKCNPMIKQNRLLPVARMTASISNLFFSLIQSAERVPTEYENLHVLRSRLPDLFFQPLRSGGKSRASLLYWINFNSLAWSSVRMNSSFGQMSSFSSLPNIRMTCGQMPFFSCASAAVTIIFI